MARETAGQETAGQQTAGWGAHADVLVDLADEETRLSALLHSLDDRQWRAPSGAPGWSVTDVVLHLAQSEEAVTATLTGAAAGLRPPEWSVAANAAAPDESIDALMEELVQAERDEPAAVLERWETARRAALEQLAHADPAVAVPWAAAPLRPRTLATTRLAEHWAHGLDVTEPLGLPFDDTARLRHIAWLGHRSLPYAFAVVGETAPAVYCELSGPAGESWTFGAVGSPTVVRGPVGDFCRVGARRIDPERTRLRAVGPQAQRVLALLRNYAA